MNKNFLPFPVARLEDGILKIKPQNPLNKHAPLAQLDRATDF
jgi:hypothetical protein